MKHWVYVLESVRLGIRYIGSTGKTVEERLKRHNRGDVPFTRNHRPWKIIHAEPFSSRSKAVKRERRLKSGAGREELKQLLQINIARW